MNNRKLKVVLIFTIVFALCVEASILWLNQWRMPNFLYPFSTNLKQHRISLLDSTLGSKYMRPILFQGSSSVSGNDVPVGKGLFDYFNLIAQKEISYNLACPGGNLINGIFNFTLAKKYAPKLVIYGISPDSLEPTGRQSIGLLKNLEKIRPYLPLNTYLRLQKQRQRLSLFSFFQLMPNLLPTKLALIYLEKQYQLKLWLYGESMSYMRSEEQVPDDDDLESLSFTLLNLIENYYALLKNNQTELVVFFSPLYRHDLYISNESYVQYLSSTKKKLELLGVRYFDYSNLFNNKQIYFLDTHHRTALGNKQLAQQLFNDLQSKKILNYWMQFKK